MGRQRSEARLRVEECMAAGMGQREIEAATGLSAQRVYWLRYAIRDAKGEGGIDTRADAPIATATRKGILCIGSVQASLRRHDRALGDWLVANTPEGGHVADTLLAIALDAMNEENEK